MALIKHSDSDVFAREAVVLDLGDLAQQAQRIIADAQDRAAHIIAEAQHERDRLINSAHAKGHAEGVEAGRREGVEIGCEQARSEHGESLDTLERGWRGALEEFDQRRGRMLDEARTDVLVLAMEIARRVTRSIVTGDDSTATAQLEKALAHTLEPTHLVIRIHGDDETLVAESAPALLERFARSAHAEIVTDDSLSRGDCVIDTDAGQIDARIDAQLDRITAALGLSSEPMPESEAGEGAEDQP